ncbi:prepilin-type N-terminal cleavage/methylation domain-containing protein [bacterium]|nr:prepilin-type N-terminal cleavage/methylation domain-containing protein [bacterium]
MSKKLQAFTLIELMVVVAIIAILGTMSVANFSSSIKRTRNSVRVSDMQAAAKGSETCYDALSGSYAWITDTVTTPTEVTGESDAGPFAKETNTCLNKDVVPALVEYPYYWISNKTHPQKFTICAALEPVTGWESVGNSNRVDGNYNACLEYSDSLSFNKNSDWCYYCASQSQ